METSFEYILDNYYDWLTEEDFVDGEIIPSIKNKVYIRTFKDDELRQYIDIKTYPCKIVKKIRTERVEGKVNGGIEGSYDSSGYSYTSGFAYNGLGTLGGYGYSSGSGLVKGSLNGKINTGAHFIFVLDINNGMRFDELEVSADDYYRYNENDIIYCKLYADMTVHRDFIPSEIAELEQKKLEQEKRNKVIEKEEARLKAEKEAAKLKAEKEASDKIEKTDASKVLAGLAIIIAVIGVIIGVCCSLLK